MDEMTIGQVAREVGIRPSAIRYYESAGLLPKPRRSSGQRRYGPDVLLRLRGIRLAQRAGFQIREIRRLFSGFPAAARPSERWRALARDKLAELDELIDGLQRMKELLEEGIRCRCTKLEDCAPLGKRSR